MPRKAKEMGALQVGRLRAPGRYAVGGVAGLELQIAPSGARTWCLRTMVGAKRREIGLGGFPDVPLAAAREAARAKRALIAEGIDPIQQAKGTRDTLRAAAMSLRTFDQCAKQLIEDKAPGWRNAKHAGQWTATLETYASPFIGSVNVGDIALNDVLNALKPIWQSKPETASRLRSRIEQVLDWAAVHGLRSGMNPARWKGNLDQLLPARAKLAKVEHHKALPIKAVPAFMKSLKRMEGTGARALEFTIVTAVRSGETRGATRREFDLAEAIWTIPGARMKAGKEHRVPLTPAAIELLQALPGFDTARPDDIVFKALRGGPLSDMTLSAVMRRMKLDAVPHGFRSTFRDWCAEHTEYPREVAEMALAHVIENKVEAAYRRGDLFNKRRNLMADWAAFLEDKHAARAFEQAQAA